MKLDPRLISKTKKYFAMPLVSLKEGLCLLYLWLVDNHSLSAQPNKSADVDLRAGSSAQHIGTIIPLQQWYQPITNGSVSHRLSGPRLPVPK